MTLYLLLVSIACLTPITGVLVESSQSGLRERGLGLVIAGGLAVAQWVIHDRIIAGLGALPEEGWRPGCLVVAYYASIPAGGAFCLVLNLALMRRL